MEHVDSWPKILLFRTHHLWNSSTELMYIFISRTSVWSNEIYTCTYQNIICIVTKIIQDTWLQNVRISELFLMLQSFANKKYYSDLYNDKSNCLLFLKKTYVQLLMIKTCTNYNLIHMPKSSSELVILASQLTKPLKENRLFFL